MKHAVTTIALVASVALMLVIITLWIRSYWRLDVCSYVRDDGATRGLASYQGGMHFIASATRARTRSTRFDAYHVPPSALLANLYPFGGYEWHRAGFAQLSDSADPLAIIPNTFTKRNGVAVPAPYMAGFDKILAPWLVAGRYDALIIPYWPLTVGVAFYPLRRIHRGLRAHVRRRRGQCGACGYDLRTTPDRCPECGASATHAQPISQ